MTIENMVVTLNRVPEIRAIVDSGTDWTVLFGFVLTAVAVFAGAWVSVFTYKRTARNQVTLAKAVAIKESRQAWINELRNTCADYIAAIGLLQVHAQSKMAHQVFISNIDTHDKSVAANLMASWEEEKRRLLLSAYSLSAKIHLLSNPNETAFKELIVKVQAALKDANSLDNGVFDRCGEIVEMAQGILKTEWNRAKQME